MEVSEDFSEEVTFVANFKIRVCQSSEMMGGIGSISNRKAGKYKGVEVRKGLVCSGNRKTIYLAYHD